MQSGKFAGMVIQDPTYPTGSLDFLRPLESSSSGTNELSEVRLRILISGAGIGGLASAVALARRGHKVTVLEKASKLAEIGAGIQIPPNSCRLLLKWGLGTFLEKNTTEPQNVLFHRWRDGEVIGRTRYIPEFEANFGAPYYVIHRAHLHQALHERATQLGVEVRLDCNVTYVDAEGGSIQLEDNTKLDADLIVAADGVHSTTRSPVFGGDARPAETGFVAYRCAIDIDEMVGDPEMAWMLEGPNLHLWIGQDTHVMSYPIAAGKTFNLVVNRMDHTDPETWNQEESLQEMRSHLRDWDPKLQKMVSLVRSTLKWPLLSVPTLDRMVEGRSIILGDAAHAMIPYMAQGAAVAVEDAGALAEALHLVKDEEEVPAVLETWEAVRRRRAKQMQEASELNTILWHFPDGAEQEARDESMRAEVEGGPVHASGNQWSDPTTQRWCYGYDAEEELRRAWNARHEEESDKRVRNDSAYGSASPPVASDIGSL